MIFRIDAVILTDTHDAATSASQRKENSDTHYLCSA